jgi:spore maturation protein CgeB
MSRNFSESLPLFDLVVTTKSYNAVELEELGARHVMFVDNAFEPTVHRPLRPIRSDARDLDVVFVGSWESERASSIQALAESGIDIHVFGSGGWAKTAASSNRIHLHEGLVLDDAYSQVLSRAKIALGFLRKANRDLQTTRSVEIPACGAVLAAERTGEHARLFREDKEAVFFSSEAELVSTVGRLLDDDTERERIALAGLQRIRRGDLSNEAMIRRVIASAENEKRA